MITTNIHSEIENHPILNKIIDLQPIEWLNPNKRKQKDFSRFPFSLKDIEEAEELWQRFVPYFERAFPQTQSTNGILESELTEISNFQNLKNLQSDLKTEGKLYLKQDNALPLVGSIKARGGFYEVLYFAEKLALENDLISKNGDYSAFASDKFREFFGQYKIGVGSTGNLGLSIGTISAKLGFQVSVYMSADAKEWKKQLLRDRGAKVIEFSGDFGEAIAAGREETQADPMGYFVDDENSDKLYLGYAIGALRLSKQLTEKGIKVDQDHPLFVYSPCGVGGSPGGTAFGLKQIYGDNVHCFFVEPTHSPAVLSALVSGLKSEICVQDLGIDNKTEADGLAVGRASAFATAISEELISGMYTLEDDELFELLAELMDTEGIFLEPSATAGLIGPQRIAKTKYFENFNMNNATHIAWATGGDLVPEDIRQEYYDRGRTIKN